MAESFRQRCEVFRDGARDAHTKTYLTVASHKCLAVAHAKEFRCFLKGTGFGRLSPPTVAE